MAAITTNEVANIILTQVAAQSLVAVKANTCATRLVNRQYEAQIGTVGETINIAIPPHATIGNLTDGDSVTLQNPTIQKTQLVLNNHKFVSFQVTDVAQLFTPVNVHNTVLSQFIADLAENIDASIISAAYAGFTSNNPVGAYNTAITDATILQARKKLVNSKTPKNQPKCLVVSPSGYGDMLAISRYSEYQTRGPAEAAGGSNAWGPDQGGGNGQVIAWGSLGRINGFEVFENQVVPITNTTETHNIAFAPDAIIFAQRMLPTCMPGTGAVQTFVEEDAMALRVTLNYNSNLLANQITVDTLYGVGIGRNEFGVEVRS